MLKLTIDCTILLMHLLFGFNYIYIYIYIYYDISPMSRRWPQVLRQARSLWPLEAAAADETVTVQASRCLSGLCF